MLKGKRGVSIISLCLCAVAIMFVVSAVVVTTNNSAMCEAERIVSQTKVVESSAYTKVYKISEVETIARQAFVNNYLAYYDGEVDLLEFEALVLGEMAQTIPMRQLDNYAVFVSADGVEVEYR